MSASAASRLGSICGSVSSADLEHDEVEPVGARLRGAVGERLVGLLGERSSSSSPCNSANRSCLRASDRSATSAITTKQG
jgi:hypothetical protein